jgi:type II secretory pathway pseudopilin PulG
MRPIEGKDNRRGEQGSMLVGLVVAVFLILVALSVAAPKVAQELRREREVEAIHRANQYVRAIQLYYRKGGMYPASLDILEKSNNIRFLRQRYADPMTGKPDWRLIKVGEAKTTVKGFFGKPLTGLAPGLGSAAGMASGGGIGAGAAGSAAPGAGGPRCARLGPRPRRAARLGLPLLDRVLSAGRLRGLRGRPGRPGRAPLVRLVGVRTLPAGPVRLAGPLRDLLGRVLLGVGLPALGVLRVRAVRGRRG